MSDLGDFENDLVEQALEDQREGVRQPVECRAFRCSVPWSDNEHPQTACRRFNHRCECGVGFGQHAPVRAVMRSECPHRDIRDPNAPDVCRECLAAAWLPPKAPLVAIIRADHDDAASVWGTLYYKPGSTEFWMDAETMRPVVLANDYDALRAAAEALERENAESRLYLPLVLKNKELAEAQHARAEALAADLATVTQERDDLRAMTDDVRVNADARATAAESALAAANARLAEAEPVAWLYEDTATIDGKPAESRLRKERATEGTAARNPNCWHETPLVRYGSAAAKAEIEAARLESYRAGYNDRTGGGISDGKLVTKEHHEDLLAAARREALEEAQKACAGQRVTVEDHDDEIHNQACEECAITISTLIQPLATES